MRVSLFNQLNSNHSFISKYKGLKRIEEYELPHPSWRFIRAYQSVPDRAWTDAPHGWTIRCCPQGRHAFGLPAKHRLGYKQLSLIAHTFCQNTHTSHFVIYPSWEFDFSGCCLITSDKIIIEIVTGDIAKLLKCKQTPDTIYSSEGPYNSHLVLISGEKEFLSSYEKSLFLKTFRKIATQGFVVLEWTKTTEGRVLFHDFLESC